jgi:hypothetical protein
MRLEAGTLSEDAGNNQPSDGPSARLVPSETDDPSHLEGDHRLVFVCRCSAKR